MKNIILCADDYGQNSAISQAIVELLREKKISATSCLVTSPEWPAQAKWLEPLKNQIDMGLHFNLTEGKPLSSQMGSFLPLKKIIIQSQLRQLSKKAIMAEFHAQLDQFVSATNQQPDFIDGHQHVHQFPIVRDAIFEVFEERLRNQPIYFRCTYNPRALFRFQDVDYKKQLIIQLCGGIQFKRELIKRNIPHNTSFAGIYHFSNSLEYSQLFPRFLNQVQQGGIIMCHPGLVSSDQSDAIQISRHHEYKYFCSSEFHTTCQTQNVKIVRYKDL